MGFLLFIAFVGAIFDWRYVRAGGKRPTRTDLKSLLAVVLAGVVLQVWLGLRRTSAEALGYITGLGFVLTFFGWEIDRWAVRRKNPVLLTPHTR